MYAQVVVHKSVDMVDMGHSFPNCSVDLGGWVWCVLLGNFVVISALVGGFIGALVGDDVVFSELVGATFRR